jgi:hypothetical protein
MTSTIKIQRQYFYVAGWCGGVCLSSLNYFSQSIQLPERDSLSIDSAAFCGSSDFILDLVLTLLFTTICPWYWYQVGERERGSSPHFHGNQQPYRYTERELHLDFDIPHPCSICCFIFFPALTKLKPGERSISFIPTAQESLKVFVRMSSPPIGINC